MARKVKETPVLRGKEAETFKQITEANKARKVSSSDYKRAQENYKRFSLT
ncbi:hypothetical protein MNBD_GAMMA26-2163 [hydrothermal vent metagenome]|uniref:Uncharacterized protein n=1 Tax=hydrothermal vent metagenome TaxID=652676 RepID=A0A3B1BAB0_9ZZZZ